MLRSTLLIALVGLLAACGADDPEPAPDRCAPDTDAIVMRFADAAALHAAPDWRVERPYLPVLCYGDPDCAIYEADQFAFEAPAAGRYRFDTDYGDLFYTRPCGEHRGNGLGFDFDTGLMTFEVDLAEGDFVGVLSYQWTDFEPTVFGGDYFVQVTRIEAPEEE